VFTKKDKPNKKLINVIHTLFIYFYETESFPFEAGKKIAAAIKEASSYLLSGIGQSMLGKWLSEFKKGFDEEWNNNSFEVES